MGATEGKSGKQGDPNGLEAARITAIDPIDDVTSIPFAFKHAALIRVLGAKLQHEQTPCGLVDIMDMLAYGETDPYGESNFLQESLVDPRVRPHRSNI